MSKYGDTEYGSAGVAVGGAPATDTTAGIVKLLAGPGFAPADTAVRGDDYRLGVRGGVRFDYGDMGALPSGLSSLVANGTWTMVFNLANLQASDVGTPHYSSAGLAAFGNLTDGISLFSSYDLGGTAVVRLAVFKHVAGVTTLLGEWVHPAGFVGSVALRSTAGVWELVVNGVVQYACAAYTGAQTLSCIGNLVASGASNSFRGDILLHRYANFAMTDAEALGASRNEAVGRLAFKGVSLTPASPISGTSTNFNLYNTHAASGINLVAGKSYRVRVNISGVSGPNSGLPGLAAAHFGQYQGYSAGICSPGDNTMIVTSGAGFSDGLASISLVHNNTIWSNGAGATMYTATILEVSELGTVANYAPENCTSLNRWLDNVGGYHLAPVGGVVALNPQPVQWRTFGVRRDTATNTTTMPPPAGWGLVGVWVGWVRLVPPAYLGASDVLCAPSAEASTARACTRAVSGGNAKDLVLFDSSNNGIDGIIAAIVTYRE